MDAAHPSIEDVLPGLAAGLRSQMSIDAWMAALRRWAPAHDFYNVEAYR
jgi:hypothetical protein